MTVSCGLKATEEEERVRQAIQNLFPDAGLAAADGRLSGAVRDIEPFRARIWELRIIDTARGQILHGLAADDASTRFRLSKQAALARHVSFTPRPHVLGDIEVLVEHEPQDTITVEQWAWWLCPETKDGEIVGPV